jgi:hypothetical protein
MHDWRSRLVQVPSSWQQAMTFGSQEVVSQLLPNPPESPFRSRHSEAGRFWHPVSRQQATVRPAAGVQSVSAQVDSTPWNRPWAAVQSDRVPSMHSPDAQQAPVRSAPLQSVVLQLEPAPPGRPPPARHSLAVASEHEPSAAQQDWVRWEQVTVSQVEPAPPGRPP